MSDYGRRPTKYLTPPSENLPANSIYNNVKVGDTVKPKPHLMRMFKIYTEKEIENPPDLPTIDFEEFGKNWLPLFNYGAHENQQIPVMDWVEQVSGNPYREVRLMRWVDGVYTEVARIPGMYDRLAPVMREGDRDYFIGMAAYQSIIHRTSGHINEANGFIDRNLTQRIEYTPHVSSHYHVMNAIFKMYGVERVIPDWITQLDKPTTTTPVDNDIVDGEFEEIFEIDEW